MKTVSTLLLAIVATLTVACGYGSKNYTTTGKGSMPAIATLNPNSATAGGQAFTLTVNGTNFATKAVINWGGAAQSTTAYVNGTQLTLAVPASAIANSGTVQITVTNPATTTGGPYGGGNPAQTSAAVPFTVN